MRRKAVVLGAALLLVGIVSWDARSASWTKETLAQCLSENDWLMYGSITCSACRAQRKGFGKAFEHITEIECNPNMPDNQVDLCLARKIAKTPTWIREVDGKEVDRIVGYQLLEDLASRTGCDREGG